MSVHEEDDDGTPAHLAQLDKTLVDVLVAKLKPMPLGYGGRLELNAFAETRTIHDGRRVLNLLRYMVGIIISRDVAARSDNWREVATTRDRERLRDWWPTWAAALANARAAGHGAAIDREMEPLSRLRANPSSGGECPGREDPRARHGFDLARGIRLA